MTSIRDDQRPTKELINIALAHTTEDEYWGVVNVLWWRGTREVFESAHELCAAKRWRERELGADILGQLGSQDMPFAEETLPILTDLLANDKNPNVLHAAASAMHNIKDARAIEPLLRLKNHLDADVRYAVVHGLLEREDKTAVNALIELSSDLDTDVRDWATFGLAQQIDADSPEIRQAFLSRLDDKNAEIRGEALVGLALRRDERVVEPLFRELEGIVNTNEWNDLSFQAAAELADTRLYPVLMAIKEHGVEDVWLEHAIAACRITFGE
jgi:HEAT repeat protein